MSRHTSIFDTAEGLDAIHRRIQELRSNPEDGKVGTTCTSCGCQIRVVEGDVAKCESCRTGYIGMLAGL